MTITTAIGGDATHQKVALLYIKQGLSPIDAMNTLKLCNFVVNIGGTKYKVKASSVASIMTGFRLIEHQVASGRATCTKTKGLQWK